MKKGYAFRAAVILLALLFVAGAGFAAEKKSSGSEGMKTETKADAKAAGKELAKVQIDEKIDINSAGKEELMKLSGIGDVTAQKIIDGRPYKSKDQLKTKKIVTAKEYEKIKNQIIAKAKK